MLSNTPNLLYCRYDWGGGDFESAIEGAGHVGNREVDEYIITQGARSSLPMLSMLGKTNFKRISGTAYYIRSLKFYLTTPHQRWRQTF